MRWLTWQMVHKTGVRPEIYQRFGFDARGRGLVVDGLIGPMTRGAQYLDVFGQVGIRGAAIHEMLDGAMEEGGNNRGRYVDRYVPPRWRGKPWCAFFVSHCLREVWGEGAPYSGGAQRLGKLVARGGERIEDPMGLMPDDILVWQRDGPDPDRDPWNDASGHIGVVIHVDEEHLYTVEGNRGRYGIVRVFRYRRAQPDMHNGPFLFGARYTGG